MEPALWDLVLWRRRWVALSATKLQPCVTSLGMMVVLFLTKAELRAGEGRSLTGVLSSKLSAMGLTTLGDASTPASPAPLCFSAPGAPPRHGGLLGRLGRADNERVVPRDGRGAEHDGDGGTPGRGGDSASGQLVSSRRSGRAGGPEEVGTGERSVERPAAETSGRNVLPLISSLVRRLGFAEGGCALPRSIARGFFLVGFLS